MNIPLIGPLLVVQEDFASSRQLAAGAHHALFTDHVRETWTTCHGLLSDRSDCLTAKGFDRATHHLGPGIDVDVYNLHMDAGWSEGDVAAIDAHSRGHAMIVAGDTWRLDPSFVDAGGRPLSDHRAVAVDFRVSRP